MLPGVTVTRIATHPADAADVYVTVANFGNSHVFRSTDGGLSWADIDGGALPDAPHHAVLIRPDKPTELYVCSDAGVHVSPDGGATWLNATGNLPPVMVVDLVYQIGDQDADRGDLRQEHLAAQAGLMHARYSRACRAGA